MPTNTRERFKDSLQNIPNHKNQADTTTKSSHARSSTACICAQPIAFHIDARFQAQKMDIPATDDAVA
ncbi:hypothetical protein NTD86_20830 [Pseudomonas sp. 7P_10.2_Bac1]|uniref:hypothetical protein n=1 Tax=Pseudomonas sp. 7P_10.2_Bac1 TaxID=2971614 RepID=UPI0021CA19EF|nr:hypothetical protein [Pseudomonas sp. 7P_10.2_Bac1]MCU1729423.1 hypothetical protein [Pseudomonas sp. 7P_10.2_Bac1]